MVFDFFSILYNICLHVKSRNMGQKCKSYFSLLTRYFLAIRCNCEIMSWICQSEETNSFNLKKRVSQSAVELSLIGIYENTYSSILSGSSPTLSSDEAADIPPRSLQFIIPNHNV